MNALRAALLSDRFWLGLGLAGLAALACLMFGCPSTSLAVDCSRDSAGKVH